MQITGTTPASGPAEVLSAELKSRNRTGEEKPVFRLYRLCLIHNLWINAEKGFSVILDQQQP